MKGCDGAGAEEGEEGREKGCGGGEGGYERGARRSATRGIGGYKGLTGIHELLLGTPACAEAIRRSPPAAECSSAVCRVRGLCILSPSSAHSIQPPVALDYRQKIAVFR